mmetsp:Transcript_86658/g.126760  ORF Transcript_86658/g.126760 Transcript_86658/m.126760 type:complete len:217 (-) Transcript_86658:975-1625(-)
MLCYRRSAIGAEATQNIDNTRRKSGLFDQLTHHQGRQRSFFAAFQDTGAARSEEWRPLPSEHEQRKVPRNNASNNTNWLTQGEGKLVGVFARNSLALHFVGPTSEIAKVLDRQGNVDIARHGNGLAVVETFDFGDELLVPLQEIGQLQHQIAPCCAWDIAPGLKCSACGSHSNVDIFLIRALYLHYHLLIFGVDGSKGLMNRSLVVSGVRMYMKHY